MSNIDIVRAWKDEMYREKLSEEQRALLPAHPAGEINLTDAELTQVAGGTFPSYNIISYICCEYTNGNFTCWTICYLSVLC